MLFANPGVVAAVAHTLKPYTLNLVPAEKDNTMDPNYGCASLNQSEPQGPH